MSGTPNYCNKCGREARCRRRWLVFEFWVEQEYICGSCRKREWILGLIALVIVSIPIIAALVWVARINSTTP